MACFGQKTQPSTQKVSAKPATVTTPSGATATFKNYVYSPNGFKNIIVSGGPKGRKFKNGLYTNDGKICVCVGWDVNGNRAVAPGTEIIADGATISQQAIVYIPSSVKYIGDNTAYYFVRRDDLKIIQGDAGEEDD